MAAVTVTAAAANTFTAGLAIAVGGSLSISGTFVGNVTFQRSFDAGVTWQDVGRFSIPTEQNFDAKEAIQVRAGFKTGDYVSGAATIRIGGA